jgi:hypothetical protein
MLVTNEYGRSLASPNLYRISAQENLYTFQSYAGLYFCFNIKSNELYFILFSYLKCNTKYG